MCLIISFHSFFFFYFKLTPAKNIMLHSFLVGEGARTWAKSKGIALPATIAEADEVNIFYLFTLVFFNPRT